MKSENVEFQNLIFSGTKRASEVKWKTFSLVLQVRLDLKNKPAKMYRTQALNIKCLYVLGKKIGLKVSQIYSEEGEYFGMKFFNAPNSVLVI